MCTFTFLQRLSVPINGNPDQLLLVGCRRVAVLVLHTRLRVVLQGNPVKSQRGGGYVRVTVVIEVEVEVHHVFLPPQFVVSVLGHVAGRIKTPYFLGYLILVDSGGVEAGNQVGYIQWEACFFGLKQGCVAASDVY